MTAPTTREPASLAAPVTEIRSHFPALVRREGTHPVAYFDGPGGTQVPLTVANALRAHLLEHNANTHWAYPTSIETDTLLAEARDVFADFLRATPADISFGNNTTTITFHMARALARGWKEGDEIVVTELDHHGNIAPWRALERDRGVTIRTVKMKLDDGRLDWASLESSLNSRTKVLAIGAASNAVGTITDIAAACRLAKAAGNAIVFVDAVHYAPHHLVDVNAIGCDFLACSAYKFYGPHIGVLWGKRQIIEALDAPRLDPAPQESPERLETGTQNHEGIVGAAAAVDFLASLAAGVSGGSPRRDALRATFAALHSRGSALAFRLWDGLRSIDGVRVYGPSPSTPRTPTVSFTLAGATTDDVAVALANRGVFVSNGDFYAATVIERFGLVPGGLVRVGCSCYTTDDEVDRLLDGVRALAHGRT